MRASRARTVRTQDREPKPRPFVEILNLFYMAHTAKRLGEAYFRTPRTTITAFLGLLAVLEQHPSTDWRALVGTVQVEVDSGAAKEQAVEDDELASFKLGA